MTDAIDEPSGSAPATASGAATSTPPYSSEGPTLPVLESAKSNGSTRAGRPAKRATTQPSTTEQPNKKHKTNKHSNHASAPTLAPLSKPWTLLPAELRASLGGEQWWSENTVPVLFTKNQNMRSGVNILKTYLGATTSSNAVSPGGLTREDGVLAISAMGAATTKLVGIVEVVRRVVGSRTRTDTDTDMQGGLWFMYTSLSSVEVEKEEEEEEDFEPVEKREDIRTRTRKSVPVLTVWMSGKGIRGFGEAFGEERVWVGRGEGGDVVELN